LIPFVVTIPEEERDPELYRKLEAELPGILAWAVQGCLAYQRDGLRAPDKVRAATEEYRQESNPLGRFLAECCDTTGGTVSNKALSAAFAAWCSDTGEPPVNAKTLAGKMREAGFDS
jgi:putative DNA primase/helicase